MLEDHSILITGGGGFIGSHLVGSLAVSNDVKVLDIDVTGVSPQAVECVRGDVRDEANVEEAMDGIDIVLHQAALVSVTRSVARPKRSHSINVSGTLNVLEAARRHDARVVVASSAAIYGEPDRVPIPESLAPTPSSPYGLDKLSLDHYARLYAELYGLETVALRYFNVYGNGQKGGTYTGVIDTFLQQASRNDPLTVHGDGSQTRDFVHVDDVVHANLRACQTDATGRSFNIGSGSAITIRELAEMIRDITGSDSPIRHVDPREGDVEHSCADITRAEEALGYTPSIELEDGLRKLVKHR